MSDEKKVKPGAFIRLDDLEDVTLTGPTHTSDEVTIVLPADSPYMFEPAIEREVRELKEKVKALERRIRSLEGPKALFSYAEERKIIPPGGRVSDDRDYHKEVEDAYDYTKSRLVELTERNAELLGLLREVHEHVKCGCYADCVCPYGKGDLMARVRKALDGVQTKEE